MTTWNNQWSKFIVQKSITPTRLNVYCFFSQIPMVSSARILDMGCGSGSLAQWWHKKGYDVLGADQNDKALAITASKGIRTQKEDVENLSFVDNTFDLVYSDGLLEHFEDCSKTLSEIFRVSKDLVLTILPRDCLYNSIISKIIKPPIEYKKSDDEWMYLHSLHCTALIMTRIQFGLLAIMCGKDSP